MNIIFNSSIGKKIIVALMGLFLCLFLIVHLIGNLKLFINDYGFSFNKYSAFMSSNIIIKIFSWLLYLSIIIHVTMSIYLLIKSKKSRSKNYYYINRKKNSTWISNNMALLGTIILFFIIVHMSNFWWKCKFGYIPYIEYIKDVKNNSIVSFREINDFDIIKDYSCNGFYFYNNKGQVVYIYRNLYKIVVETFKISWIVFIYIISMIAISAHLLHGFQSAFRTLGINFQYYGYIINIIGIAIFSVLVPLLFAIIPIYFFIINNNLFFLT